MQIQPYLNFPGQCEEAFKFYAQCFGGEVVSLFTFGGSPMAEHAPAEWQSKVMHSTLKVGNAIVMGSDAPADRYTKPQGFYVSVSLEKPADAERVFATLADRGSIEMPIQETFWALRFGMCVDRFGIPWMVNCEKTEH